VKPTLQRTVDSTDGPRVKAIVRTVLGLVLVVGLWTITGNKISTSPAPDRIPTSVFGGGAGVLEIEAEATTAARMAVSFSDESGERHLETYEKVGAGTYRWSIDVPSGIGGYVELDAHDPKAGDRLKFRVRANGRTVFEGEDRLDQPLDPGYPFLVQAYFADYAKGKLSQD
jgi:hypothetical protein